MFITWSILLMTILRFTLGASLCSWLDLLRALSQSFEIHNEFFFYFILSIPWSSMAKHVSQSMTTFEFHTRAPYSLNFILMLWSSLHFLLLNHIICISSVQWSWCQYSTHIFVFMACNIEFNTWSSSIAYEKSSINNSIKPLVHRECH